MTPPLTPTIPRLERPAFFDGQRLGPDDLDAVFGYHRDVRWLHNRSLHNWGIAVGFEATGKKDDREVFVAPGYAIDCAGRDIVLSERTTLSVPAETGPADFYLTASFVPDEDLTTAEERTGVCDGSGAVRRIDKARLRWQRPPLVDTAAESRYRRGLDLILATALVEGCRLAQPLALDRRHSALGETRPFIAAGATPEGATEWTSVAAVVQTVVDTSQAGFRSTPRYFAHVLGARTLNTTQAVDGFVAIDSASASPTSFTLRVALPRDLPMPPYVLNPAALVASTGFPTILKSTLQWSVSWIGIES